MRSIDEMMRVADTRSLSFSFFPTNRLSNQVVGNISTLELAYVGSPPSMKSLVMAFGLMTSCLGSIIGFIVNPFYSAPRMIYFQ